MQRPYYPPNKCSQGQNSLFRSSTNGLDQYLVTYDLSAQTPTAAKLRCSTVHLSLGSGVSLQPVITKPNSLSPMTYARACNSMISVDIRRRWVAKDTKILFEHLSRRASAPSQKIVFNVLFLSRINMQVRWGKNIATPPVRPPVIISGAPPAEHHHGTSAELRQRGLPSLVSCTSPRTDQHVPVMLIASRLRDDPPSTGKSSGTTPFPITNTASRPHPNFHAR